MSDYNFYYELKNSEAVVYNSKTKKVTTMKVNDVYKLKRHYSLLVGYEANEESLIQFASDFFVWVDQLKTNDIYTFDYLKYASHETACVQTFLRLTYQKYEEMGEIDPIEYEWIEACNNAGLRYCKRGKYDCHGYDYSSHYPAILASESFAIPTQQGTLRTIKALSDITTKYEVGYYKVKITSNDERFNKIFAYSYTQISVYLAVHCRDKEKLNVNIEVIDEENNCYVYGKTMKDKVTKGSIIFGKWYRYLFQLKEKFPKNKLIKYMTSALWGRLAEHNRLFKTEEQIVEEGLDVVLRYNVNHKYYIRNITQNRKHEDLCKIVNCKNPYYYKIARIKPFLLDKARYLTAKVALKYIDDVVRICVDNVTFDKEHDDVMYHTNTFKLVKEKKTTGLIAFRRYDCYRNFTNEKYTTKHYYKNILDDEECE